jgi:outer membrane protein with beta-barrel domain
MKKLFFVLFFFVSTHSFSQIKTGIEAGYNSARFAHSGEIPLADYGNSTSSISTFHAGIISDIPLSKKIFLQPALLYYGNGTHINGQALDPGYESSSNTTIQIYYLRLPVNVVCKMKLNNRVKLMAGTGLYAAKGLSGTGKGNIEGSGLSGLPFAYVFNSKVNFSTDNSSSNETNINPFDFGFNFLAGIEWKNFQLTANYSQGFSQVYADGGFKYKNAVLGISLACLFSLKK